MDPDVEFLIEEIENAFGVQLNRRSLSDETTVDALQEAVVEALGKTTIHRCWSSIVFWRFRRALTEILPLPKSAVNPSMFLEDLIPLPVRRATWKNLAARLNLKLPRLEYQGWFLHVPFAIGLVPLLWGLLTRRGWWCIALAASAPVIATALLKVAAPFATDFPVNAQNVRDVVRTIVGLNYSALEAQLGPPHEREVRDAIKRVIMDLTGAEYYWLSGTETNLLGLVETTGGFRVGA
jgi:hypothetical protein